MRIRQIVLPLLHNLGLTDLSNQQVRDYTHTHNVPPPKRHRILRTFLPLMHAVGLTNLSNQEVEFFLEITK